MPVTLTIKQVPDRVADKLRVRAAASHRSLQGELMAILEEAVSPATQQAWQTDPPAYVVNAAPKKSAVPRTVPAHGKRMTLAEAWERARRLGPPSRSESVEIVRKLRDERGGL